MEPRSSSVGGRRAADRTERFRTGGIALHALRWDGGPGTPFVLVHGLASCARLWDGVAAELSAAGHPVLALDQRGHGRSDKPEAGPDAGYDMATVSGDLAEVVRASGFERPVVVGQSWGGNVVVELAARFPGLARAIGCVDGGAIDLAARYPDWEQCARELRPPPLAGTPSDELERMLREAHPDWPEAGIQGTLACFERRDDGTVAPWLTLDRHLHVLRGLWDHRPAERLPLVHEPVLFLVADGPQRDGGDDERRAFERVAHLAPGARVEWLVGDHDLHAQQPSRVAALVRTLVA